jgi:polyphosphate kinase
VIDECLVPYLHDRRDAWELDAEGHYQPVTPAPAGPSDLSAQGALMRRF